MSSSNPAPTQPGTAGHRARLAIFLLAASLVFAALRAGPALLSTTTPEPLPRTPLLVADSTETDGSAPSTPGILPLGASRLDLREQDHYAPGDQDSVTAAASPDHADLGPGFVVWESNRTGQWRLWRRRLDGSGLRRLTADDHQAHCCAHISPDGSHIAYLRYDPGQQRGENRPPPRAALHLMRSDGSDDRVLWSPVRLPSESRAVTWLDEDALLFVDVAGHTQRLDLTSKALESLTRDPHPRDGWLMNPTLDHATTAWVTFSPYDADTGTIAERRTRGGCQPYFSADGRWGYWMAGAGGPLNRIDLVSRQVSTVLRKNDPRLPTGQAYIYFPMLSRDGRLLAFGASPGEHDFSRSNYDIFVVETEPSSLEVLGRARRLTDDPATDRFPDIYSEPLALGRHDGEAPLEVGFRVGSRGRDESTWRWDFGDGTTTETSGQHPLGDETEIRHLYRSPGRFEVTARRAGDAGGGAGDSGEDDVLLGHVSVTPARPPQPVTARLEGDTTVRIGFDEAVNLDGAEITLVGGRINGWRAGRDGHSLVVELAAPLTTGGDLELRGILDRAQRPNSMAGTVVAIEPPSWPVDRRDLVLLWQTGDAANLVDDPTLGAARTYGLEPRGRARLDHAYRMQLAGGAFVAPEAAATRFATAVRDRNEVTVELVLSVNETSTGGRGDVLAFSAQGSQRQNLTIYQSEGGLHLEMGGESVRVLDLDGTSSRHLVLTYSPGQLRAYVDGAEILASDKLQDDQSRWRRRPLVFGSGPWGDNDWQGVLEGIALYSRVLEADEIAENARRYHRLLAARPVISERSVVATLRRRSRTPSLEEIAPYRQALVVQEYVIATGTGTGDGEVLRVAQWAILDGEIQPAATRQPGDTVELRLQPFAANPQLESLYLSNDLPPHPGLELLYDADS